MSNYLELKNRILEEINKNLAVLTALSDDLADNPEVSGQEFETSKKITKSFLVKSIDMD